MNIAIVTGASSGMGREFVLQLSDYVQVDEIWVIARRADALPKHIAGGRPSPQCRQLLSSLLGPSPGTQMPGY